MALSRNEDLFYEGKISYSQMGNTVNACQGQSKGLRCP